MARKSLVISLIILGLLLGISFLVTAEDATSTPTKKTVDIVCVQKAIEKRESAVQTAFDVASDSIKSALQARKSALLAAWAITDNVQRKAAVKAAWAKFKQDRKAAQKTFKQTRDAAWKQFKTDRKACKVSTTWEIQGADLSF